MEGKGWTWEGEAKEWSAQVERLQAENERLRKVLRSFTKDASIAPWTPAGHGRRCALCGGYGDLACGRPEPIPHAKNCPVLKAREALAASQPQGAPDPTREERKQ